MEPFLVVSRFHWHYLFLIGCNFRKKKFLLVDFFPTAITAFYKWCSFECGSYLCLVVHIFFGTYLHADLQADLSRIWVYTFFLGMNFCGEINFHGGISPLQFRPFGDYVPLPHALHWTWMHVLIWGWRWSPYSWQWLCEKTPPPLTGQLVPWPQRL